jgi:hypothetical protein
VPGRSGGRRLIASPTTVNISTHVCGSSLLAAVARVRSPTLHSAGEVTAGRDGPPWCLWGGANGEGDGACTKCARIFLGADSGAELMFAKTT